MKRHFAAGCFALLLMMSPFFVSAQSVSSLVQQLETLRTQLATLLARSSTQSSVVGITNSCPALSRNLYQGMLGRDVTMLQSWLIQKGHLAYGNDTGLFGELTQNAVQKFQCAAMDLCSGSPDVNGYGAVGPATRAAITKACSVGGSVPVSPPPGVAKITATPTSGSAPLSVILIATIPNTASDLVRTRYAIDVGDGSAWKLIANLSLGVVNHIYERGGDHTVRLMQLPSTCTVTSQDCVEAKEVAQTKVNVSTRTPKPTTPPPPPTPPGPGVCSAAKIQEIIAPAASANDTVAVNCSASLPTNSTVTKRVALGPEANGTTLDCNGSTLSNRWAITVSSRYDAATGAIQKAEDITVKNCRVTGTFQVATGVNAETALRSSRTKDHTQLMRSIAPTDITLEDITLAPAAGVVNGIYLALGTTDVTIKDSVLTGSLTGVPLYLDAESGEHTIVNNRFEVDTSYREQIAIDGSSNNVIRDNTFRVRDNFGAIQIYRNCGENAMVRHNEPRRNVIQDNTFTYIGNASAVPGVWLGSRNVSGSSWCNDDAGYPFGSSLDNHDFARNNTVRDNAFHNFSSADAIRDHDESNTFSGNTLNGVPYNPGETAADRDARRVADLEALASSLSDYHDDKGEYPHTNTASPYWFGSCPGSGASWGVWNKGVTGQNGWVPGLAPAYLDTLPLDPKTGSVANACYIYRSNGTDYMLLAYKTLEHFTKATNPSPRPLHDGVSGNGCTDNAYENSLAIYTSGAKCW